MEYRTLGRTGIKVSEIGFGGEWLGIVEFTNNVRNGSLLYLIRRLRNGTKQLCNCIIRPSGI